MQISRIKIIITFVTLPKCCIDLFPKIVFVSEREICTWLWQYNEIDPVSFLQFLLASLSNTEQKYWHSHISHNRMTPASMFFPLEMLLVNLIFHGQCL